jgi:hypothetical protein
MKASQPLKKQAVCFIVLMLLGLFLGACRAQTPEPTLTLKPTQTPLATTANTPAPSVTPEPTAPLTPVPTDPPEPTQPSTPTVEPALELGEVQPVPEGGYSFRPLKGYETDLNGAGLGVMDREGTIIISLFGVTTYDGNQTQEEIIDQFLGELEERQAGKFEKSEGYPITVGAVEGLAFDLTGNMFDAPIQGQAILVMPSKNQFLFGLAIANQGIDKDKWEKEGSKVFSSLLESIEFIQPEDLGGSACLVASDKTYGYSKDYPIKVGGDWLDGPARERMYLDSLAGPGGETIRYERTGSIEHGDTILDIYQVSYTGSEGAVTLYIDEYHYEELMAPVGWICRTPIPLSAP